MKNESLVKHVNDTNFEKEVIDSDIPVFVDFWAPWCGPCRMVAPLIEKLAEEFKGRVKFVKYNTEESQSVAAMMGIRSIPTLVIFKGRDVVEARIGARPLDDLRDMVLSALGEKKKGFISRIFS